MTSDAGTGTFEAQLARALGRRPVGLTPLGGGDVADSFRVEFDGGVTLFAKRHLTAPPGFFGTEALGLQWLGQADAIAIPEVIAVSDDPALLVLDWIEPGRSGPATEADLGRGLAALHLSGAPCFGREDARTTGSRRLPNDPTDTWTDFYAQSRLLPLARLAADQAALPGHVIRGLERLAGRLDQVGGPVEPAARLHGDLWAGNRIIGAGGTSWLIDPAAHGGHREFDLAMMRLFGGFDSECFAAYHEVAPLASGWQQRIPLHQLAPLAVHAIKFGGHYAAATEDALAAIS